MRKKRFFGLTLIFVAFLIILFNISFTGAVIGIAPSNSLSLIALVFFIVGLILIIKEGKLEKNLAQEVLKSSAIITDPKKIKKIARKMHYEGRNVKEGYQILDEYGKPLTVVPLHKVSGGVYRNIMKALSTGKPNFRIERYSHT